MMLKKSAIFNCLHNAKSHNLTFGIKFEHTDKIKIIIIILITPKFIQLNTRCHYNFIQLLKHDLWIRNCAEAVLLFNSYFIADSKNSNPIITCV